MTIRAATIDDCESIAQIHVTAWRESYRGIVPDSVLDGLSIPERADLWGRAMSNWSQNPIFVAEKENRLVGFVCGGACRDERLGQENEIYAIYLLSGAKRHGIGGKLLVTLANRFLAEGAKSAGLWVLKDNWPARRFYEKFGGQVVAERVDRNPGYALVEAGYAWPDLRRSFQNKDSV